MVNFKNIPDSEKPRERLYEYGCEYLSNEELLAIILRTGSKNMNVKELSLKVLAEIGNIKKFKDIGINSLMLINGIGKVKAIEIKAALEFGRRVYMNEYHLNNIYLNNSVSIYKYFSNILNNKKQEYFYSVYVDTKGKFIDKKCLFIGTINSSIVHPREIFKEAYLVSANGLICVHNHPSGDSSPSKEDIIITKKIKEISIIHGINFIDHIIIGKDNYFSFFENNML